MTPARDGLTSCPVGPPSSEFVLPQQDFRRNEDSVESPVAWLPLHLVAFEGPAQFAHHSSGEAASIKSSSLRESKGSVSHSRVLCSVAQQSTTFRAIDLTPGIIPLHHPFSTMRARGKAVTAVGFAIAPSPSADEWDSRPTSLRFPDLRHELTLQRTIYTVSDASIVRASPSILDRECLVLQRDNFSIHSFWSHDLTFNSQ